MAGPTNTSGVQLAGDLTNRVYQLEKLLSEFRNIQEVRSALLESQMTDRIRSEEQFRERLADMTAKQAATEERCRQLERNSDRTWQVWLALISAGVALVVSILKK